MLSFDTINDNLILINNIVHLRFPPMADHYGGPVCRQVGFPA